MILVAPSACADAAAGLDQPRPDLGARERDRVTALDQDVEHHLARVERLPKLVERRQLVLGMDDVAHVGGDGAVGEQRALDQRRPRAAAQAQRLGHVARARGPARSRGRASLSRLPWRRASDA